MAEAPQLFQCPTCHGLLAANAASCPHCGFRPPAAAKVLNTSAVIIGLAGGLIAVGSFLPWMTATSIISISRTGMDGGGDGIATLALGVVLILVAVGSFEGHGIGLLARTFTLLGGLGALGIAVFDGLDVTRRSSDYVSVSLGWGLLVVGVGASLALMEAVVGAPRPRP